MVESSADGTPARSSMLLFVLGVANILFGALLFVPGIYLAWLGGSWYYSITGIGFAIVGWLLTRKNSAFFWISLALALYTLLWSYSEVGFAFWPSVPRLATIGGVVLVLFLSVWALPKTCRSTLMSGLAAAGSIGILAGFVVLFTGMFQQHGVIRNKYDGPAAAITPAAFGGSNAQDSRAYGRTPAGTRYAPFEQINVGNVTQLKEAWRFQTGDPGNRGADDENAPLAVGGKLYVCTPRNIVIALDGQSGKELWRFDPKAQAPIWQRCRGVSYFDASSKPQLPAAGTLPTSGSCSKRILSNTIDGRLYALDADTGTLCTDFGKDGFVDLREGLGTDYPGIYMVTSAPTIAGNIAIIGGYVMDNYSKDVPSGVVRGFSAITGELVWAWDMGDPSITKYPPPGKTYTRSTPNMWSTPAFDPDLGLVYLPIGNPSPDLWGGNRTPIDEQYGSSVVALEIATGRERWRFQTVHHDLWDYDVPSQPALVDMPDGKGGTIPGLIQLTKRGQIFYLDRRNGKPVAEVQDKLAPIGALAGDWTSISQPYSVGMPSVGDEPLSEQRMWGATPFDQLYCRIWFRQSRYVGEFTPHSSQGTILYPSNVGGFNWGSATVDERRGLLIVNDMRIPMWMALVDRERFNQVEADKGLQRKLVPFGFLVPMYGSPYGVLRTEMFSPLGVPCNDPPYGTYTAIDLSTRKIVWQQPAGTVQDAGPLGIKTRLPIPVGMPTLGGGLTTAGGLSFHANAMDFALRAFETSTGRELWKGRLPIGSQGTPVTYLGADGKQYIVLTVGGNRSSATGDRGDYVIAYSVE